MEERKNSFLLKNKNWHQSFFLMFFFFHCSLSQFPNAKETNESEFPFVSLLSVSLGTYVSSSRFDRYVESNLEWSRFLGKWHEIKRIDNPFQMGLTNVTADYALREDGNIRVKNEGETITGRSSLEGVAIIVNPSVGKLKVSFLYPLFFGDYLILKIDRNGYQTALIGGPEPNFLWIFSREPTISSVTENEYIQFANTIGYDTNRLLAY